MMDKKKTNKKTKKLVRNLPADEPISDYWLRVPKKYAELFADGGVKVDRVVIVSQWYNGIWVKIDDTDQIHPITGFNNFKDILDWEIIQ